MTALSKSDQQAMGRSTHERSLLATVLAGLPMADIAEVVTTADFGQRDYGFAFSVLREMVEEGVPVTEATVEVEFRQRTYSGEPLLDALGGIEQLWRLFEDGAYELPSGRFHAEQVAEASRKRQARTALQDAIQSLETSEDSESIIARTMADLRGLESGTSRSNFVTVRQAADHALECITAARGEGRGLGVPTHLTELDEHIGGMQPGTMIVLAARPSVGKSCLGAEIAQRVAEHQGSVLFAALEMSDDEMGQRFLSRLSGIPTSLLREPTNLSDSDMDRLFRARDRMADTSMRLWGQTGDKITALLAAARRHKAKFGLDLLVLDYMALIKGQGADARERIGHVSKTLKQAANELCVPVLALAQLNRESEKNARPPRLSDLAESGAIEQDADQVWLINRERDSTDCILNIAKFRNGPIGEVRLYFDQDYSRVLNWSDRPFSNRWTG